MSDLFLTVLISALAGARILYVLINIDAYWDNFLDIFKIWNGGLVFSGALSAVPLGHHIFTHQKMDIWKTADVISPGLALGHSVGRFGCLFRRVLYGKSCSLPIAITFTNPDSLAPLNILCTHPAVYDCLQLCSFMILLAIQRRKRFNGMVFLSYIMLYSAFRSIIEFFRGDFGEASFLIFCHCPRALGCWSPVSP